MIEIGKNYRLVTLELTPEGYATGSIVVMVTGREGNLLQVNGSEIINLSSPLFHSLTDEEGQAAYFKRHHDEFLARLVDEDKEL